MQEFEDLGLSPDIIRALRALNYTAPTPIQVAAIPHVLEGRDLMGLAQTGTGKTAAFGLPLIQRIMAEKAPLAARGTHALILAPTRELANQIADSLRGFSRGGSLRIRCVVGGMSISKQTRDMERGTDILVATPGRLLDLVKRKALRIDTARYLVLDEADQMLDLGFIHTLRLIATLVAKPRQTMLFSATMPKQIEALAGAFLTEPVTVETARSGRPADKVRQSVHFTAQASKSALLKELLEKEPDALSLVFMRTKHSAEKLMKSLVGEGFNAVSVHGNKSQGQRDRALDAIRSGTAKILVATDVAARGIDIPGVNYVYNYDLPEVAESYVHRIGRTARAGADGEAVAFCTAADVDLLKAIEKLMGMSLDVASGTPPARLATAAKPGNSRNRGRGGRPASGGGGAGGGGNRPQHKAAGAPNTGGGAAPAKRRPRIRQKATA